MLNLRRVDIHCHDAAEVPPFKLLEAIAAGATEKSDGSRHVGIESGPKNARQQLCLPHMRQGHVRLVVAQWNLEPGIRHVAERKGVERPALARLLGRGGFMPGRSNGSLGLQGVQLTHQLPQAGPPLFVEEGGVRLCNLAHHVARSRICLARSLSAGGADRAESNVVNCAPSSAMKTANRLAGSVALALSLMRCLLPGGSKKLSPAL